MTAISFSQMTASQKTAYKKAWYDKNKQDVQLNRITKGIVNANRTVSVKTLEKYGLKQDENGVIQLPRKGKLVFEKDMTTPTPNVRVALEKPIPVYDYTNVKLTGTAIKSWIQAVFKDAKKKGSDEARAKTTTDAYYKIPETIFRVYNKPYDGDKDLTIWITDAEELIKRFNKQPWQYGTKSGHLGKILQLSKDFEPLTEAMTPAVYSALNTQCDIWKMEAKSSQRDITKNTVLFAFNIIKNAVMKHYGEITSENLLFQLYDEVIFRDNAQLTMAYNKKDMTDDKVNYLLLTRGFFQSAVVYMNEYKTHGKYGKIEFPLSKKLTQLILQLHTTDVAKKLFPFENNEKLGDFMGRTLRAIPLFKEEPKLGIYYIRHSVISTKLMKLKQDKYYIKNAVKIAGLSMHSPDTQVVYVSPLKNAAGKRLATADDIAKVEEALDTGMKEKGNPKILGKIIKRDFDEGIFIGTVVEYRAPFYMVRYEDGDSEDFLLAEIKKLIKDSADK
jgi:hypothetical protein